MVADSLSAMKYGKFASSRDETGLIVDYQNEGNASTPQLATTTIASIKSRPSLVTSFMEKIRKHPTYRNATHTQSVLTITSNVVYGKATEILLTAAARANRSDRARIDARPGQPWLARVLPLGRKASLQGCARRHQLHRLHRAAKGALVREGQLLDEAIKAFDVYFDRGGFT